MTTDILFQRINEVVPTLQGWCELEKAHALAAAVITLRPRVCVEIGVFAGRSLIPLAMALKAVNGGAVYAIDPWTKEAATEGYDGANAEWWASVDLERVYANFLGSVNQLQLGGHVIVQRAKSDAVEPPDEIDLCHIDGQHTDQATRDARRFASRVRVGGLCFLDDIAWSNGNGTKVASALDVLFELGFVELYRVGTGAVFQRVS
jgi:predicted O-methyltransferase YrrM